MTDPIADFLTRIRNAVRARLEVCNVPHSKLKERIADILKAEGYIAGYTVGRDSRGHPQLALTMKYLNGVPVLTGVTRVSTPGRRLYYRYTEIPRVLNGLGMAILSTSKGVMKDQDCRRQKAGGELICNVW